MSDNDDDDDAARRQAEISIFSAMATGGSFSVTSSSITKPAPAERSDSLVSDPVAKQEETQQPSSDSKDFAQIFAEAANASVEINSGTLNFTPSPQNQNKPISSNLEAAVAALTGEEQPEVKPAPTPPVLRRRPEKLPAAQSVPMHSERLWLPRPLFFGPILPPRLLKQCRTIVGDAVKEAGLEEKDYDHQLHELPPQVRNLISAIDSYGFGLSPFPIDDEGIDESSPEFWRGNSYLCTHQPVWGNAERADRQTELKKKRMTKEVLHRQESREALRESAATPTSVQSTASPDRDMFAALARGEESVDNFSLGGSVSHDNDSVDSKSSLTDKNLFSQFARGEGPDGGAFNNSFGNIATPSTAPTSGTASPAMMIPASPPGSEKSMFAMWAREGAGEEQQSEPATPAGEPTKSPESNREQTQFSKWALGNPDPTVKPGGTMVIKSPMGVPDTGDTFRNVVPIGDDSDEDSVVGNEMKKMVGINENLDAALQSFAKQQQTYPHGGPTEITISNSESISREDSQALLSQLCHTTPGGRPLTNLELTSGCVPVFESDDPSLPVEADLGIYETKEDQQRSCEQRRAQEIIEKHTMPNVFGPIACPNPATGPDDNHSFNSRTVPIRKGEPRVRLNRKNSDAPSVVSKRSSGEPPLPPMVRKSNGTYPRSSDSIGKPPRKSSRAHTQPSRFAKARYGWWNVQDGEDSDPGVSPLAPEVAEVAEEPDEYPLLKPPTAHAADSLLVNTGLTPSPAKLREDNSSLSRLHPATSVASMMPFLSDRPPSWRYLQIDTKAIGFPPLNGEIEPLFCSLAIYHVETMPASGSQNGSVPAPDVHKCGRVTEILNFDVITTPEIEVDHLESLWPHLSEAAKDGAESVPESERTKGTRCGLFPIPSNLNVANLYAILVVERVLSSRRDNKVYSSRSETDGKQPKADIDLDKYRERAKKSAERQGKFLMPFAFGVTPLLQVFGTDVPTAASSRAVQIPLFQFNANFGERQIIDHIMVMLYPRADHGSGSKSGPAPLTNGGTAMLVMRYFGYLGLHSVVQSKSSLARRRLVDFSGELQIRRLVDDEEPMEAERPVGVSDRDTVIEPRKGNCMSEPTTFSGRNIVALKRGNILDEWKPKVNPLRSPLYAVELAPLPLDPSPRLGRPPQAPLSARVSRSRFQSTDSEPYFHTAYCNELLCNPRLLYGRAKGNVVIKLELRELDWNVALNSYVARLPPTGPHLHNQRRGPPFVHESYTSCLPSSADVQFLNDFKVKLPLLLSDPKAPKRRLVLFFSAFHVRIKTKKTWTQRGANVISKQLGVSNTQPMEKGKSELEPLGCGFLPLASDTGCLVDNGLHDVKLCYGVSPALLSELDNENDEVVLTRLPEIEPPRIERSTARDAASRVSSLADDESMTSDDKMVTDPDEVGAESVQSKGENSYNTFFSISEANSDLTKPHVQMALQIRITVHSSIHPQNATVAEFLQRRPNLPRPLAIPRLPANTPWKKDKEEILRHIEFETDKVMRSNHTSSSWDGLLRVTIELCTTPVCPNVSLASHLLRLIDQVLLTMVTGGEEASLVWANPAGDLPLRTHAFATLLHLIVTVSTFLSKFGLTELDGKSKWNQTSLSRMIALTFDEKTLFQRNRTSLEEPLDTEAWNSKANAKKIEKPKLVQRKSSGGRRGHVRKDSDSLIFAADSPTPSDPFKLALSETDLDLSGMGLVPASLAPGEMTGSALSAPFDAKPFSWTDDSSAPLSNSIFGDEPEEKDSFSEFAASFGGLASAGRRGGYMTLPNRALSTIKEDGDVTEESPSSSSPRRMSAPKGSDDIEIGTGKSSVDSELVKRNIKVPPKKMRIPKRTGLLPDALPSADAGNKSPEPKRDKVTPLTTDDAIESAGEAFLDAIGANLGYSRKKTSPGEEKHVGQPNHRKTRSRCSIDWTIPDDDLLRGDDQTLGAESSCLRRDAAGKKTTQNSEQDVAKSLTPAISSLNSETSNSKRLPNYLERVMFLAKRNHTSGRWFPYVYEVIICQWSALLSEQKRCGDPRKSVNSAPEPQFLADLSSATSPVGLTIRDAAVRARGYAISSAPVLFELIKKSLASRMQDLVQKADAHDSSHVDSPPLVRLDTRLVDHLEKIISLVTDACIDNRNFDSWDYRQASIDINDAVVRFLRDLFALLEPRSVHRLILTYFSRFVAGTRGPRNERDSKIGLKFSKEVFKMRLNAVTAFVRFQDFVRVNSPQMLNWSSWPLTAPADTTKSFFDKSLESFFSFGLPGFVSSETSGQKEEVKIPALKPHWLAELTIDICLAGVEHPEQKIQQRAASLLHELFWSHSMEGKVSGTSSLISSMYVSFLSKIMGHISYLSSLGPKTQLRKDLMPCVVLVLQCAPTGLLRSFWRKLCVEARGKGMREKFGFDKSQSDPNLTANSNCYEEYEPHIFDMFSLLNIALATFEYEGGEDNQDYEGSREQTDQCDIWMKEYLPAIKQVRHVNTHRISPRRYQQSTSPENTEKPKPSYTSTSARKWHSHDASLVVINSCRYIVRELHAMMRQGKQLPTNIPWPSTMSPAYEKSDGVSDGSSNKMQFQYEYADIVVFVRAAASVYLHSLTLRESDIVTIKTLTAAVEMVKIFGIKIFLESVGQTLQHWMRVVVMHCGARRADVRIQALEFLWLGLRATWDCFGSFFRIRIPLLAVQTEVMDRIVAMAATRYYREQRQRMANIQYLTNDSAEACLSMLWRTLDRLHHQSASQNVAFRSALVRLAQRMKKLYRAYIAAHALSIVRRESSPHSPTNKDFEEEDKDFELSVWKQSRRISVHRIIMASAGYSKQFLGLHRQMQNTETVAHNEAVEDAFLDAADVFSSTELPSHRVAWLQKLAEFHISRQNLAEGATCYYQIHLTYRQASRLHQLIWSSIPFLPWTNDGVHVDGEGPAGELEDIYDAEDFDDYYDAQSQGDPFGRQMDKSYAFRRMFHRAQNSITDWEIGNLFYGVTLVSEFSDKNSWMSRRDMEERMIEAAEAAGELYRKAGIAERCRAVWGLATSHYAHRYNFAKLADAHRRLALVVSSQVPAVDTNDLALDFSHPLGRFYRVWFHGGAPDDLLGAEFVYRAPNDMKLDEFGKQLSEVIKSILPDNTPIDLVLEDGRPEESGQWRSNQRRAVGLTPMEPVNLKVTPLRPLARTSEESRGTPEWFHAYTEAPFQQSSNPRLELTRFTSTESRSGDAPRHGHPNHGRSNSASIFSSGGTFTSRTFERQNEDSRSDHGDSGRTGDLIGVENFSFLQPMKKNLRNRTSRDWLKISSDIGDKNLRVTQLHCGQTFPACVSRQSVLHRTVFSQSPLEAGVDAVCAWCSVLFRTAVATNGMVVDGTQSDAGIGNAAAKVVSDCIHASRVKDMGLTLLNIYGGGVAESDGDPRTQYREYQRLSEVEVKSLQMRLARAIVVLVEILHLLIARNRNQLLAIMEARKSAESLRVDTGAVGNSIASSRPNSVKDGNFSPMTHARKGLRSTTVPVQSPRPTHSRSPSSQSAPGVTGRLRNQSGSISVASTTHDFLQHSPAPSIRKQSPDAMSGGAAHHGPMLSLTSAARGKIDTAITIQAELQRSFLSLTKALYPNLERTLGSAETPIWLKECTKGENYFSGYTYRDTKLPIADELCFFANEDLRPESEADDRGTTYSIPFSYVSSAEPGLTGLMHNSGSHDGSFTDISFTSRASRSSVPARTMNTIPRSREDKKSGDSSTFQIV